MALVMNAGDVASRLCNRDPQAALRQYHLTLEDDIARLRKLLELEVNKNKALKRAFYRPAGDIPRLPSYLPLKTQELIAEVAVLEEEVVRLENYVIILQQDLHNESLLMAELEKQNTTSRYSLSKADEKIRRQRVELLSPQLLAGGAKIRKDVVGARLIDSVQGKPKVDLQSKHHLASHSTPEKFTIYEKQYVNQYREDSPVSNIVLPETSSRLSIRSSPDKASPKARSRETSPTAKISAFKEAQRGKENYMKARKLTDRWPQVYKDTSVTHESASKISPSPDAGPVEKMDANKISSGTKPQRSLSFQLATSSEKTEANRLSEEIMKCLLSIYRIMTRPSSFPGPAAPSKGSKSILPGLNSQSCTTSRMKTAPDMTHKFKQPDPYFELGERLSNIGPYSSLQSINANSFDYSRIADAAFMLQRLKMMVQTLEGIDLRGMSRQQKLAFWINVYNICMMHGFLEYGIPASPHQVMALMHKAVLNVGGYLVNALAIEHFILQAPCHSAHAFADILCKEKDSIQNGLGLESPEPSACFALCCGSYSSPAIRVYTPSEIEGELEVARKEYLQAAVGITNRQKVAIPKLLDWHLREFAKDAESLIKWISQHIPVPLWKSMQECISKANGIVSRALEVMPYDFTFRILLA